MKYLVIFSLHEDFIAAFSLIKVKKTLFRKTLLLGFLKITKHWLSTCRLLVIKKRTFFLEIYFLLKNKIDWN